MLNSPNGLQLRLIQCYFDGVADEILVDDLVRDEQGMPTLRLLSAVLPKIHQQHPGCRALDKLQGQLRYFWVVQQLQQQALADLAPRLAAQGIPFLVIGGSALSLRYYPRVTMRSNGELDVLVSSEHRHTTEQLLGEHGWSPTVAAHPDLQCLTSYTRFSKGAGVHLNLHCRLYPGQTLASLDAVFARSINLESTPPVSSLAGQDHLLWLLATGAIGHDGGPLAQWILDSILVIKRESIDWDQLAREAVAQGVHLRVAPALRFLAQQFGVIIPATSWHILKSQPFQLKNFLEYRATSQSPQNRAWWARTILLWRDYQLLKRTRRLTIIDFLSLRWGCQNRRQLLTAARTRLISPSLAKA